MSLLSPLSSDKQKTIRTKLKAELGIELANQDIVKFEFSQPALKYMPEDKDVVAAFEEAAATIHKIITDPNYELFERR